MRKLILSGSSPPYGAMTCKNAHIIKCTRKDILWKKKIKKDVKRILKITKTICHKLTEKLAKLAGIEPKILIGNFQSKSSLHGLKLHSMKET